MMLTHQAGDVKMFRIRYCCQGLPIMGQGLGLTNLAAGLRMVEFVTIKIEVLCNCDENNRRNCQEWPRTGWGW